MGVPGLSCFRVCVGRRSETEDVKESSRTQTVLNQSAPAAHSPAAKQGTPDGVLASPFSRQLAVDASPALSTAVAAPVGTNVAQTAAVAALAQPAASNHSSRAQSSELSAKGLQEPLAELVSVSESSGDGTAWDVALAPKSQGGSSNDICLRPHGVVASRTPSRGDSAADVVMDKAITPVLLEQDDKVVSNTTAPRLSPTSPTPGLVEQPVKAFITVTDVPVILPSQGSPESSNAESRANSKAPSEAPTNPSSTLYDKLGGPEALEAAVDLFYEKVLADERLSGFFEGTNMMRLVIKQVQFMVYAFGGAAEYKGKDLKAAHFHLVQNNGLNVEHFDMVAVHFQNTLNELKIPQADINEAMQTLGSVRSSFDPKSYIGYSLPSKLRVKATALKDPTTADALASLIPASKAEEALVKKAGSKGVVMAAVRVFYMRVMNDEMLRPFFEDIDLARLKNKLVSFLAYAFGGGVGHQLNFQPRYKGRDLAFMHSHMVEKGLTMEHFDSVLRHFCQTLRQLNMPQSAIDEAKVNLNKTRDAFQHVINKAKDPNKNHTNFISADIIANMQGDKAALLAEVQARMVANPEMAKGIGLEPIDPKDAAVNVPVMGPVVCPFPTGQAKTPKGREAACPMGF
ncbi:hypothetical protein ABBQ32_012425 [Trebouxia sp. C0010 RCD-2024]